MKSLILPLILIPATGFASGGALSMPVTMDWCGADAPTAPTEIIVDLVDDATAEDEAEIEAKLGGLDIVINSIHAEDEQMYLLRTGLDADAVSQLLKDDPRVETVEPNYFYYATGCGRPFALLNNLMDGPSPSGPNDPRYKEQWSFEMIGAPAAWTYAKGAGVTVAVIDTGVAYENHKNFKQVEDLRGTKFASGYDFVNDDKHANDDHGHGTHVAGTIAQATNNNIGVAGLAYESTIMPLKVLSKNGSGTAADIADAIRFAADHGAQVINMSLGGGPRSLVMQSAVAYARKKGVVVVCAAGNGGRKRVEYPAAYKGALAVSSVGPTKKLAYYSSYGKEVQIAAPGGDKNVGGDKGAVLQNTIMPQNVGRTDAYLFFQGTSMAAPHVAGAAALIISAGVTDPDTVEKILRETAEDVGKPGHDVKYGHGILNIEAATKAAAGAKNGWQQLLATLIAIAMFIWKNRHRLPLPRFASLAVGGVIGGAGLSFLTWFGIADASILTTAMPTWDLAAFGADGHFTLLWASALPMFALTVVLMGFRKLRLLIAGLSIGWAAYFLVSALGMPADVQFMPGIAGLADRVWLLVNAGALAFLASLVVKVEQRRTA